MAFNNAIGRDGLPDSTARVDFQMEDPSPSCSNIKQEDQISSGNKNGAWIVNNYNENDDEDDDIIVDKLVSKDGTVFLETKTMEPRSTPKVEQPEVIDLSDSEDESENVAT